MTDAQRDFLKLRESFPSMSFKEKKAFLIGGYVGDIISKRGQDINEVMEYVSKDDPNAVKVFDSVIKELMGILKSYED